MKIFIETERLILREMLLSDADGMFALDADPEVVKYFGNNPMTDKEQAVKLIQYVRQQYEENGIGRWVIVDKKTNDFIGWTGLKLVTTPTNNHTNFYDIGYRLQKKYWGQGIASESALPCLHYAFKHLPLEELCASAHIENVGSNKILRKIGLKFVETFEFDGMPCNWYRMTRNEYDSLDK